MDTTSRELPLAPPEETAGCRDTASRQDAAGRQDAEAAGRREGATPRRERGDAVANRARILCAARRLLAEHGSGGVSMEAVAAAAGVGKGTVFRRFGDRAGLTEALVSDYLRDFQDAFLTGPPPLGPGAPPAERLEAFLLALVRLQREHLSLAMFADHGARGAVYSTLALHVRSLVHATAPALDADVTAALLLGAIAPPVLRRLDAERCPEALDASLRALVAGLRGAAK